MLAGRISLDVMFGIVVDGDLFPIHPFPHPITGFKDDSACVTTKTADRITEGG